MCRGLVLDDFQAPDAGPLVPPSADKQTAIAGRAEQSGAGAGQICLRIKILGNANRVAENHAIDIVFSVHIDAADELGESSGFGQVMAAGFLDILPNKMKRHSNFFASQMRES